MRLSPLCAVLAGAPLLVAPALQEPETVPDVWEPFAFFVGSWEGEGRGPAGTNRLERTYELVLDGRYLHSRNEATFETEVHRNWDFLSWDKVRGTFVLRQFHVEGFVNRYTCTVSDGEPRTFVFESEGIENLEPGWGARLTLTILDGDSYRELFELRQPGKGEEDWFELATGTLKRVR